MTCPCEIVLQLKYKFLVPELLQQLQHYVDKYSRFLPDSLISKINNSAGKPEGFPIDAETCCLLKFIDLAYEASNGDFDPTINPLLKLWSFRQKKIPSKTQILKTLLNVGWHDVRWCETLKRIWLPKNKSLDFGGFVKEYIADQLVLLSRKHGCESGYINLGGDIAIIDDHSSNHSWCFGITDIKSTGDPESVIRIQSGALSTSGSYERQFTYKGKVYSHIISPSTGEPIDNIFQSVSIYHENCLLAGFYSTVALIKQQNAKVWLENADVCYRIQ